MILYRYMDWQTYKEGSNTNNSNCTKLSMAFSSKSQYIFEIIMSVNFESIWTVRKKLGILNTLTNQNPCWVFQLFSHRAVLVVVGHSDRLVANGGYDSKTMRFSRDSCLCFIVSFTSVALFYIRFLHNKHEFVIVD